MRACKTCTFNYRRPPADMDFRYGTSLMNLGCNTSVSKVSWLCILPLLHQLLGKGQYGSIYGVVEKHSQETYAAKIIRKCSLTSSKLIQSVRHELQILYHLRGKCGRSWGQPVVW